ncbi:potassium channel family protein [Pseudomonas sp. TNT2022 ID642]|uniref:potassium channel family protein n=1 Tax=Pseudomonas sp. TNT2022 ID642 TaxID=2942632 RepID=UPI0023614B39|nr:potassium channel family protein [Pseudomonas sp. TNT2022 ID642]MDD1004968.1 potassium channel family protein [Pseudomonas sp. TNT2022 ID642]
MPLDNHQRNKLALKLLTILAVVILIFAAAYFFLSQQPNTGLSKDEKHIAGVWDCIYFSVVTITTLGYGDLAPTGVTRLLAALEALFGLIFAGYSISQVMSLRQETLIEYLTSERIKSNYNKCIEDIIDAKEQIGDRRRFLNAAQSANPIDFTLYRDHPFYLALKNMKTLSEYTAHVEQIGRTESLIEELKLTAHHIEELASLSRKYLHWLVQYKVDWKTRHSEEIVIELCDEIEKFSSLDIISRIFSSKPYKGGGDYVQIVTKATQNIRSRF